MVICAISGCSNSQRNQDKLSFYSFPKDPDICKRWIEACCREGMFSIRSARICAVHFLPSAFSECPKVESTDFQPSNTGTLKDTAVPTQHLPMKQASAASVSDVEEENKSKDVKSESKNVIGVIPGWREEDMSRLVETAKKLHKQGYHYKTEICPNKLKALQERGTTSSKNSLEEEGPGVWEFWDTLEELMGNPDVQPVSVTHSLTIEADNPPSLVSLGIQSHEVPKPKRQFNLELPPKLVRFQAEASIKESEPNSTSDQSHPSGLKSADLVEGTRQEKLQERDSETLLQQKLLVESWESIVPPVTKKSLKKLQNKRRGIRKKLIQQVEEFLHDQNSRLARMADLSARQNKLFEQFATQLLESDEQEYQMKALLERQFLQSQQQEHFYISQLQQHQEFVQNHHHWQLEVMREQLNNQQALQQVREQQAEVQANEDQGAARWG